MCHVTWNKAIWLAKTVCCHFIMTVHSKLLIHISNWSAWCVEEDEYVISEWDFDEILWDFHCRPFWINSFPPFLVVNNISTQWSGQHCVFSKFDSQKQMLSCENCSKCYLFWIMLFPYFRVEFVMNMQVFLNPVSSSEPDHADWGER